MPHRLVSLGILLFWAVAASSLLIRDVLPDWLMGPPPDLRSITRAATTPGPTYWALLVDDPGAKESERGLRAVGQVKTETLRQLDGFVRFVSEVVFDSGSLLRGSPLEAVGAEGERLQILSFIDVDEMGNLHQLRSGVRMVGHTREMLSIEGHVEKDSIVIRAAGPALPFPWKRPFPYRARGMVQNGLGPLDRIPGLHVGQRWESQMVSPLTGKVETARAEVTERNVLIHWNDELVPCHELVTRSSGISARTWARVGDGLVVRQEVPLFFVRLVLERRMTGPPDGVGSESEWAESLGRMSRPFPDGEREP